MTAIIIFVICVSIALLDVIFFMQRAQEFGILNALGYSRNYLLRKTFWESLGIIGLSWFIGVILTQSVYSPLNCFIFNPQGIEGLTILEWNTFMLSLPVPLTMAIFSFTTIYWHFSRMDAISIIEKRE